LNEYINKQKEYIPELDGLRVTNDKGDIICGDRVSTEPQINLSDRKIFIWSRNNPKAGIVVGPAAFGRLTKQWVIQLAQRINNPDGSFAGIVFGAISVNYITKLFTSFDIGKNGVLTLRDGELAVMARYPEPRGMTSVVGNKLVSHELNTLIQNGITSGTYTNPGSIDPIKRIFSFSKLPHYPLYVTAGLATRDFLAPWHTEVKLTVSLVSLFFFGSLVSAWFVYRNRKRETMAAAEITHYRDHLETTVKQRTLDLEVKNELLAKEIDLRKQVEDELRKAKVVMDKVSDSVCWITGDGRYVYVNDSGCNMHGYRREELLAMSVSDIRIHFPPDVWKSHWEKLRQEGSLQYETVNKTRDGHEFPVEIMENYLNIDGVEFDCSIIRDISERKEAEAQKQELTVQLNQSQKLESLGRLAGGIAHDFNNLLTPILGYAELIKGKMAPDNCDYGKIDLIMQAADKAKILTQEILSFSRKQILEMKIVDMNEVVTRFYTILRRTIHENVSIRLHLTEEVCAIRADRNQLEQIILNLAINGQDAIQDQGVIAIETDVVMLDNEYARQHAEVVPGKYLMLAITDDGCGMNQETYEHIFEPFFTTKGMGKGTGLGLAMVFGLVKQHGGHIWVYSEVGEGTVFKLYFPTVDDLPIGEATVESESLQINSCDYTILVVEDNVMVRNLVCDMLTNSGLKILIAVSAVHALTVSNTHHVDLLLSDVIMPEMNGPELYERLLADHPGLKVLYMSGYTNNVIVHHGVLCDGINFIQKPFTINDLTNKIVTVLENS
jgi:PAS domain S-box-containing protein